MSRARQRGDALRVRAIQAIGHAQQARECAHELSVGALETRERRVALRGKRLAMISRYTRDELQLARCESLQVPVQNQMVGMLVMLGEIDHVPDVVQSRDRFEQLPAAGR